MLVYRSNYQFEGMQYVSKELCSYLVVRRTQSTLSSIVVVRLPGKQEMQGSIPCEEDYPFVPFCCHSITLLLSHNRIFESNLRPEKSLDFSSRAGSKFMQPIFSMKDVNTTPTWIKQMILACHILYEYDESLSVNFYQLIKIR